jgi:hypothetical protein
MILWVKLLVGDIKNLTPKKFIEGNNLKENLEHKFFFNGLPNQCNHCCALGGLIKACKMKKITKL